MSTPAVTEERPGVGGHVLRVPRSRGVLSGLLLLLLGIWGALIPFVGPYFNYAFTPDTTWTWTIGRLWLEILPGAAVVLGGLLLLFTANRAVAVFAGWLAAAAGAWFVIGPILGTLWAGPQGAAGVPVGSVAHAVVEQIGFFAGLGAVIIFIAAQALGRFTVRGVRDERAVQRHRERRAVAEQKAAEREALERRVAAEREAEQRRIAAGTGTAGMTAAGSSTDTNATTNATGPVAPAQRTAPEAEADRGTAARERR